MDQCTNQETTQHEEELALASGIHPTCSVLTISLVPHIVVDEASLHSSFRQYILPGSKSVDSPVVAQGRIAMDDDDEVLEEYVI
jgi:hypothetical protein